MNNCINGQKTLLEALAVLNQYPQFLTIFILDNEERVVGTLTDGDVRRYLIGGGQLEDSVVNAAHTKFASLDSKDSELLKHLRDCRARGIKIIPCLDAEGHITEVFDLVRYRSHLPVDAVLMAGGKGERLRPLTEKTPKPLLPVGDKCIIDHNIDRLILYGVEHLNVTVNYLGEQIEEHFAEPRNGVKVNCYREPKFLGTIGSIKFVENIYNDTVLVMNSDLFTNIDYEDFYLHFKAYDAEMSVAAIPYHVSIPYGILDLEGRNICGLIEKPKYTYYANAGIYLVKRRALEEIPDGEFFNATDLIEKLISQGKNVIRYPLNGTWIDIGNPQEYQKANDLVKHIR